jgi:hypothetical protein
MWEMTLCCELAMVPVFRPFALPGRGDTMAKVLTTIGLLLGLAMTLTVRAQGSTLIEAPANPECTFTALGDVAGCR